MNVHVYLLLVAATALGGISLLALAVFLVFGTSPGLNLRLELLPALMVDAGLCFAFFIQHSVMIRRFFRRRLARAIPDPYHPAIYSTASGIALLALVVFWQPAGGEVYSVPEAIRWILRLLVVLSAVAFLWSIRALGAFDAFGSGPLLSRLRNRPEPPEMPLAIRGPYRYVRHPLYLIFLVLIWTYPDVFLDRLVFNVLWTSWIVVGTILEERDLVRIHGQDYTRYQKRVPMLIPWRFRHDISD